MIRALKRQLLKLIEWQDTRTDLIAYQFPMDSRAEIMNGSTLVVREGQVAILCKDGKIADIYAPGRHKLETRNMPILTTLMSWHHGFRNTFVCDVWFINTTIFTGQKWGTANPFTMRDPEFGVIRIRGFGTYNFKVLDPKILMLQLLGSRGEFTVSNIREKLRSIITSNISNIIAGSKYSAIDLATKLNDFNTLAQERLQEMFNSVGFELTMLIVENISFPEEVERAIDSRSSVGVLSDKMGSFVAMNQAKAMRDMANNPGGFGGAMMGFGMMGNMGGGMAMNQAMDNNNTGIAAQNAQLQKQQMQQQMQQQQEQMQKMQEQMQAQQASQQPAPAATKACVSCKAQIPQAMRFCGECGTNQAQEKSCAKCKQTLKKGSRFCGHCGEPV